jgi:hypothetical protein
MRSSIDGTHKFNLEFLRSREPKWQINHVPANGTSWLQSPHEHAANQERSNTQEDALSQHYKQWICVFRSFIAASSQTDVVAHALETLLGHHT